ncbi:MAG: hypothetical protein E6R03_17885 [Hyphomicrobiaceae bacterium]|nr:MAG: hypothetical protein E6R03_17885 [Hyphomicrobiaceae bacterium]
MPAGSKPGERRGGRKPGVPNKANSQREKKVAITGITPLDAMIYVMRHYHDRAVELVKKPKPRREKDETAFDHEKRVRAHNLDIDNAMESLKQSAREAAPYIHPKLATLQSTANLTGRLTLEALVEKSMALPPPANENAQLPAPIDSVEEKMDAAE